MNILFGLLQTILLSTIILQGEIKVTAYIFDHTGYHEVPFTLDGQAITDFRPGEDSDCDVTKGEYCIDRKLLSLMVG